MTERPLSRRDFLNLGFLAGAATIIPRPILDIEPPTDEELWEVPTIEKRKEALADPNYFLNPQDTSGRIMLTPQFDNTQWERLLDKSRFLSCDYKGHGCGVAVIATAIKVMDYFKTGKVPDVTCADMVNFLIDKDHEGFRLIWPNSISMYDDVLKWSLMATGQETGLFNFTQLTPDWGLKTHVIPASEWASLFKRAKKEVLDKGGIVFARVLKYGVPEGSMGHFIIISSFNHGGEPLIVDSIGPWRDHKRQGMARTIGLGAYVERVQKGVTEYGGWPGLLWMGGVVPTF